jgi:hypothetical protein
MDTSPSRCPCMGMYGSALRNPIDCDIFPILCGTSHGGNARVFRSVWRGRRGTLRASFLIQLECSDSHCLKLFINQLVNDNTAGITSRRNNAPRRPTRWSTARGAIQLAARAAVSARRAPLLSDAAAGLVQEPHAPLGLIDPDLEQACGRNIVVLLAQLVRLAHRSGHTHVVFAQFRHHR